ncbi:MAG: alkaline phosphatase [Candidatus Magasanikbacteria bacterium CG10_big_fil_rev_8_21_14_0_10_36_32]|uniref:Alkaline phosphatase n=1 Tax=Candidatus Magasanikbacteria bacterium CG10_big_fil_rev_8_21_14_0_10_36_32 TaxID=1974646 RepID=A0A2M6W7F8_9BACT|nr:MAG: alkaline phosphatase [Candidatus Magasanikbacteria bacterium CG10_big_fil_rev_8_21_14_0_10_36_32]
MITHIIEFLANIVINVIDWSGYAGVFFLMLVESCGIPMPSEVIMPFAGFLVSKGKLLFWAVVFLGAAGNLIGSWLAYFIGVKGGRPLLEKYGKYILISRHDLDVADRWFVRYGEATVFFGRLLPVVRTFISFPAGVAKMNFKKFSFYTFAGALPWSLLFAWLGVKMGNNWDLIRAKLHSFDLFIGCLVLILIIWYIWRHLKHRREYVK